MMAPEFEQAAREMKGEARFVKVDTEQNPGLARRYGIASIPSLLVFVNGEVYDSRVGVTRKDHLISMARRALDKQQGIGLFGKVKRAFGGSAEAAG